MPTTLPRRAAGTVLVDRFGRILLRRPTGGYGGYAWTFAKGGIDDAGSWEETAEATAERETLEETGYACTVTVSLGEFAGDTSVTEFFLAFAEGELAVPDPAETEAVAWVTPAAAFGLIAQTASETGRARDTAVLRAAIWALLDGPAPALPSTPT